MLLNVPLMLVALILYNLVIFGVLGTYSVGIWETEITNLTMISGAEWVMSLGDLMIVLGLILLFFEILKATRVGPGSFIDHMLSTLVFIVFLIEFLLVRSAATPVFFILMMMTLVDVLAGFAVSVRAATRDVSLGADGF
ncbi:MAG: hypothetical protein AAF468_11880 [Pseudomonadota bacterium]